MKLLAAAALAAAFVALPAVAAEPGPPTVALTGNISLVGTINEHHKDDPAAATPTETFYISLASQRAPGRRFGYAVLACFFVSVRTAVRECVGTFSLPRGKITVAGSFVFPVVYQLAVTGGTGAYAKAAGTLSVRQFAGKPAESWYVFALR